MFLLNTMISVTQTSTQINAQKNKYNLCLFLRSIHIKSMQSFIHQPPATESYI